MLDIFDEITQSPNNNEKENFSIIEEVQNDSNHQNQDSFLFCEEPIHLNPEFLMNHQDSHQEMIISRKGSGTSAKNINSPISFMYKTDQIFDQENKQQTSNREIGAALTPNVEFKKDIRRRETRVSESDIQNINIRRENNISKRRFSPLSDESRDNGDIKTQDFMINSRKDLNKIRQNKDKNLVTEDTYTEKFDYKKFINEELSKLGNICG